MLIDWCVDVLGVNALIIWVLIDLAAEDKGGGALQIDVCKSVGVARKRDEEGAAVGLELDRGGGIGLEVEGEGRSGRAGTTRVSRGLDAALVSSEEEAVGGSDLGEVDVDAVLGELAAVSNSGTLSGYVAVGELGHESDVVRRACIEGISLVGSQRNIL